MDRKRITLVGLSVLAGLLLGVGALGFTQFSTGVALHPDRNLLVRDDLALAYSLALLQMDRKQLPKYGFVVPAMEKGEKNTSPAYVEKYLDELMETSYGMANSFLREKAAVQNDIVEELRVAGRLDGIRQDRYTRAMTDFLGKPHTFRDVDGKVMTNPFIPPTPTPTPDPGQ